MGRPHCLLSKMARRAHSERPERYRTRFGVSERAESPRRLLNAAAETSIGSSSSSNPQMAVDVVNFASTTGHNAAWEPLMNNPNPPSSLSQLPVSVSSAANAHQQVSMEEFASGSGGGVGSSAAHAHQQNSQQNFDLRFLEQHFNISMTSQDPQIIAEAFKAIDTARSQTFLAVQIAESASRQAADAQQDAANIRQQAAYALSAAQQRATEASCAVQHQAQQHVSEIQKSAGERIAELEQRTAAAEQQASASQYQQQVIGQNNHEIQRLRQELELFRKRDSDVQPLPSLNATVPSAGSPAHFPIHTPRDTCGPSMAPTTTTTNVFCIRCGTGMARDASFCGRCGLRARSQSPRGDLANRSPASISPAPRSATSLQQSQQLRASVTAPLIVSSRAPGAFADVGLRSPQPQRETFPPEMLSGMEFIEEMNLKMILHQLPVGMVGTLTILMLDLGHSNGRLVQQLPKQCHHFPKYLRFLMQPETHDRHHRLEDPLLRVILVSILIPWQDLLGELR